MKRCFHFVTIGLLFAVACDKKSSKSPAISPAISPSTHLSIDIPAIDFELPTAANVALTGAPSSDLLADTQRRVNERIEKLNADMEKWKGEFTEVGTFTGKGPNNDKSGSLTEIDDGKYKYKLIVCEAGSLHMVVKWDEAGNNIYSWRDQRYKPAPTEDSRVLMTYTKTDTSKIFTQQFYGDKDNAPADQTGTKLVDKFQATENIASGVFTFSGVHDWFSTTAVGDSLGYLVGTLSSDGTTSGKFVSYKAGANGCTAFDETNTASPGWCKSRTLASGTWTNNNAADTAAAWTALQDLSLSITSKAGLVDPSVTETCPSN